MATVFSKSFSGVNSHYYIIGNSANIFVSKWEDTQTSKMINWGTFCWFKNNFLFELDFFRFQVVLKLNNFNLFFVLLFPSHWDRVPLYLAFLVYLVFCVANKGSQPCFGNIFSILFFTQMFTLNLNFYFSRNVTLASGTSGATLQLRSFMRPRFCRQCCQRSCPTTHPPRWR